MRSWDALTEWDELTEAEQAGVIQRTVVGILGSPNLRKWTPERLRRENLADSFVHQVADAMDAELAAREARKQLRIVARSRWRLPSPGARPGAPSLRVLDGYAPSSSAAPQGTDGNHRRKPGRR